MDSNIKAMMAQIDDWAADEINKGEHPPWAFYRLMQPRDALNRVQDDDAGKMPVPGPTLIRADNQ